MSSDWNSSSPDPCSNQQFLDDTSLDILFRKARSHNRWCKKEVDDILLKEIYDLARMGPTSFNCCPMRVLFVRSDEQRNKLLPAVIESNYEKIRTAPVVAIIGYDLDFLDYSPKLFPHADIRMIFEGNFLLRRETAVRNGTLQAAYLMLAARSVGLDCGPISGFDRAYVDKHFFSNTNIVTNFLCGLGYGDPEQLFDRLPRLEFDRACSVL
ncbi:MAG: malonic semialdehyde reductase [Pseudomonadota bacterium]|nr:malonic semialdehyde reductase [Pseudomonadota bacterium]